MWLRKEALAVAETPNYLAAVKVKLNNPGMGKAGLWERHKNHLPQGEEHPREAEQSPGGSPGMKGSRDVLGQGWAESSAHPSGSPGRGINQTQRGRGEKVSEGELGGEKRERKGSTRERKSQIKGRNSSEITELFIFPAASGDFFSLFFPL